MDARATEVLLNNLLANRTNDATISYIAEAADATTNYHGFYAPPATYADYSAGVDTGAEIFLIAKETHAAGVTTAMQWASASFDTEWDERASLNFY